MAPFVHDVPVEVSWWDPADMGDDAELVFTENARVLVDGEALVVFLSAEVGGNGLELQVAVDLTPEVWAALNELQALLVEG